MESDDPRQGRRFVELWERIDTDPRLARLARFLRDQLPGDAAYGDPLSVAGDDPAGQIGRRLALLGQQRPSALRELGFGALQVWETLAETRGDERGDQELAILFTDLVGFSAWTLEAGDTHALHLLREVGQALEPAITDEGGRIVKRLGDGLMAVFADAAGAVGAASRGRDALRGIDVGGYRPRMRAGVHVGQPRKLGGDYFGVDVNIAARVAAACGPDELLVSEAARAKLEGVALRRRWRFSAKGAPKDLRVYSVAH